MLGRALARIPAVLKMRGFSTCMPRLAAKSRQRTSAKKATADAKDQPPITSFLSTIARSDGRFVTYKPVTNGIRHRRDVDLGSLGVYTGLPVKDLTIVKKQMAGRNHSGRITVRGRGGGGSRRIRTVDFHRNVTGPHRVERIEFDPYRSAFLALLKHQQSSELSYIVAPEGIKAGDVIESFRQGIPPSLLNAEPGMASPVIQVGNCLQLRNIPVGTTVHNIGLKPWGKAQLCRSAGTSGQIISTGNEGYAQIKLQSGEVRLIHVASIATIGAVSNPDWMHRVLGKAGARRKIGRRPKVRGTAMNPVDHPHGGGEGRTRGKIPVTPWGIPTKGKKTRKKSKPTWWIIKDRPRGKQKN
ncbi:mitochondrial 54S ribosomal protein rml2 [Sorochytrium milnesiophthora]